MRKRNGLETVIVHFRPQADRFILISRMQVFAIPPLPPSI